MSKADAQKMLLEAGIDVSKVSVLDNGEMVKTEGEWFPLLYWAYLGAGSGFGVTLWIGLMSKYT